ncbi:MAG: nucleotidyltransferase domain-containing protein [Gloeomargaritaceae cyanobacterium C42_A2020_066]|nr:nucleotidyltransferase domain-containing protein [Gloeomargaritaceae cyanobacterium C42_A2020_066]
MTACCLADNRAMASTFSATLNPWLSSATERLRHTLDPRQVILFGSWARGTATRHSDIDLFLVWDCDLPPLERIGRVLALLADAPCPVEVIVYTPQELERCRHRPFIRQLLAEGRILLDRGQP